MMGFRLPRTHGGRVLLVVLLLLMCYAFFFPRLNNWGANSRMNLVYALGDQGAIQIDDYHLNTGDKAYYDGHYYLEKSIGPSLVAVPFYVVFRGLTQLPPLAWFADAESGLGALPSLEEVYDRYHLPEPGTPGAGHPPIYHAMALTFVTFFTVAVPSAILGGALYLMASLFATRPRNALALALVFGLATPAFAYSNEFFAHQVAAFGAFVGFYLLWRVVHHGASKRVLWLVGVLFGYAAATEYIMGFILGVVFVWALVRMRPRIHLLRVVAGAVPWILVTAAYNLRAFGTPVPVGYRYSMFSSAHETLLFGLIAPTWESFYGITLSPYRGLFLLSPFLLLALPGLYVMIRRGGRVRDLAGILVFVCLTIFVYTASYWAWTGGHSVGARLLVPMLPFLSLPIVFVLNAAEALWRRAVIVVLAVLSFASVWSQSLVGHDFPPETALQPLMDYALPLLQQGELRFNMGTVLGLRGFMSLLPLALLLIATVWLVPWVEQLWLRRRQESASRRPFLSAG